MELFSIILLVVSSLYLLSLFMRRDRKPVFAPRPQHGQRMQAHGQPQPMRDPLLQEGIVSKARVKTDPSTSTETSPQVAPSAPTLTEFVPLCLVFNKPCQGTTLFSVLKSQCYQQREGIFERLLPGQAFPLCQIASVIKPGYFESGSEHRTFPGVLVYMRLTDNPAPVENFEEFLSHVQGLTGIFHATLCDRKREPLTEKTLEDYRAYVQDFCQRLEAEQDNMH